MKAADYRNMSEADLKEQIREQRASLAKLKFNHKVAGTENPMTLRMKRREIARMITVLNDRNKTSK
jgi:large subunit ribosomal protein L29